VSLAPSLLSIFDQQALHVANTRVNVGKQNYQKELVPINRHGMSECLTDDQKSVKSYGGNLGNQTSRTLQTLSNTAGRMNCSHESSVFLQPQIIETMFEERLVSCNNVVATEHDNSKRSIESVRSEDLKDSTASYYIGLLLQRQQKKCLGEPISVSQSSCPSTGDHTPVSPSSCPSTEHLPSVGYSVREGIMSINARVFNYLNRAHSSSLSLPASHAVPGGKKKTDHDEF